MKIAATMAAMITITAIIPAYRSKLVLPSMPLPELDVDVVVVDEVVDDVLALALVVKEEELVVELVEETVVEFESDELEDVVVVVVVVGIGATYEPKYT